MMKLYRIIDNCQLITVFIMIIYFFKLNKVFYSHITFINCTQIG